MGLFDLFKSEPAWKGKDWKSAKKSVEKETDQSVLFQMVMTAPIFDIRSEALRKITDQSLLFDLAMNAPSDYDKGSAAEKLIDYSQIDYLAKNSSCSDVRLKVYRKLNDQSGLADIAQNDPDKHMRAEAISYLTDQALLSDIANNSQDITVRDAAVSRLYEKFGIHLYFYDKLLVLSELNELYKGKFVELKYYANKDHIQFHLEDLDNFLSTPNDLEQYKRKVMLEDILSRQFYARVSKDTFTFAQQQLSKKGE